MKLSICDKVVAALHQARQHNSNIMVMPEVILWPDPEMLWSSIIPELQKTFPALLIYGSYNSSKKQGPAIWLKCMITQSLPEADWASSETPIIYLPGISKNDLKNIQNAGLDFQPIMEYQYTGTVFTQENGREWTILAFLQNPISGLGIKVGQDAATKEALKKALPSIFQDRDVLHGRTIVDAEYLNNQLFPDIIPSILKWICKGEITLSKMDVGKKEIFYNLCKSQYDFEPDHKNIKAIVEKLGVQRNAWKYVWQHYTHAPKKYPEIPDLLRLAKPPDLGSGMFAFPDESWPQVNEAREEELNKALLAIAKLQPQETVNKLRVLETQHGLRRSWVWAELGQTPLANALVHLLVVAEKTIEAFPFHSINELKEYYKNSGYRIDQSMRKSLAAVKTEKDKVVVKSVLSTIYKPWLESVTQKFQTLVKNDQSIFTDHSTFTETESFILFVDAFRFELAEEFFTRLQQQKYNVELSSTWSAIPSLTPTAKPNVSPVTSSISTSSQINEFRPQLKSGKDLQPGAFREALTVNNYTYITNSSKIDIQKKYWQEIGDIDTKGHVEQSGIVKRIEELFDQVQEVIDNIFRQGVKRIKIVTDHGWLLLPGGLPKEELKKELAETRWGRCAYIKEGAKTDLLHLPWRWNPSIFIAYASGISFFKKNEEYAHGGISIHECLIPVLLVENAVTSFIHAEIKVVKWINLKCVITTDVVPDGYSIDIRTKYSDEKSSIVLSISKYLKDNTVSLMVDDAAEHAAATIVLLDEEERIIDKKPTTVGG
ncbi:BREX-1 system phosphatase PglZ type B [Chitinophaga sancti]|uniref:BREX-1 system phosphatase PglZ type B n=1 Tax=Chitinophaga sancti TaxID=1004 RepID=A0A1K1T1B8_9BACT|nr:BREX-1 system phosphatase PglZ type B [Chitinophaga sancti]WQD61004.1 BREX-1 system phosphatase PglZ type B [Chitinophaga sancti]WQG86869.1 BREX-1 system phosphatase PglZ type B [Chitinophaga sancti]SFW90392.1 PglZ domain-containing protein [Chitinophaga sancti]